MNKTIRICLLAMLVLSVRCASAQLPGCVDSPENPTAVLLVVGAAACAWPSVRAQLRGARRK